MQVLNEQRANLFEIIGCEDRPEGMLIYAVYIYSYTPYIYIHKRRIHIYAYSLEDVLIYAVIYAYSLEDVLIYAVYSYMRMISSR